MEKHLKPWKQKVIRSFIALLPFKMLFILKPSLFADTVSVYILNSDLSSLVLF